MTVAVESLAEELKERFSVSHDDEGTAVMGELQSILRIHDIMPEDLSFKWESYCLKMGSEETQLNLKTVREFKKDLQDTLERESRAKAHSRSNDKKSLTATPRAGFGGVDVLNILAPNTPRTGPLTSSAAKRKAAFETPGAKSSRSNVMSSPSDFRGSVMSTPNMKFAERKDAGVVQESINAHIEIPLPVPELPAESRFKLKANTEILKFAYKTMSMKLSEASEILDDRIEEFLNIVQKHHKLDDGAFGNPANQSQEDIVAVGRICAESNEGRLNASSLVLETSRRLGGGRRVPLKLDKLPNYDFFPGKIVALRGINASGEFFSPTEVLSIPHLLPVASEISNIDGINDRISDIHGEIRPLITLVASGPYTTDDTLDFSPFNALLKIAEEMQADGLIVCGPFIDAEHPLVQTGDFDLPPNYAVSPDKATLLDLFKAYISYPLAALAQAVPSISIVMCPSIRDAISKHVAWPQDRMPKKDLSLPRQVSIVPNPMLVSLNENLFGISSQDILDQIRSSEVVGGKIRQMNIMERLSRQLLEQRHFFPVFPPSIRHDNDSSNVSLGSSLDLSYMKLGEFLNVNPDVLITPSVLPPFAKVVEGTLTVNPGTLSKKRGPGTYARLIVKPLEITEDEREKGGLVGNRLYDRCRADIVKI